MQLAGKLVVLDPGDPLDVRRARLEQRVELAGANQPDPDLRRLARGGKDRLEAVERDQLADEQERERLLRRPAGPKEPLLGADEAVLDPLRRQAGEPREIGGVGPCVRDREIGGPERTSVDRGQRPRGRGAGAEPAAVGDERVGQRDEWVEDDGPATGGAPGGGQVEVAGVADEHDVELGVGLPQEAQLGRGQARGRADARLPALAPPLPDALVPLDDLDSGAAQAGDHLRVPRVVAVVRAEVEDSHRALGPWSLSSGAPGLLPAASVSRERARV